MFFLKCEISDNIKDIIKNMNFQQSIFINHKNVFFIFVTTRNSLILLRVYDIVGTEIINIQINPHNSIFFPPEKENNPQNPAIEYNEKILEKNLIFHFYYTKNTSNSLHLGVVERGFFTSINKVKNLFGNNINLLISHDNSSEVAKFLRIAESSIYDKFLNTDGISGLGQLSEICGNFDYPHNIINLSDGYQLFIYYGIHNCKKNSTSGILIFKINLKGQISGIYEIYNFCECFNGKNETKVYHNEINYE